VFGIYGGETGDFILDFLKNLEIHSVVTLHTILKEPSKKQHSIIQQLDHYCQRIVVMTEQGKEFLKTIYGVAPEKIDIIPHGVLDIPFLDSNFFKDRFHVEGKTVLLSFGLLSPNKGLEHVIKALPSILQKNPKVIYMIVGETHPHHLGKHGETYREELMNVARECGVTDHVVFYNNFVTTDQLREFIGAADIYITPYCNEAQICSGTLAYAFGAGKALISTPYWHAQELLENERGILVPFKNSEAIAGAVNRFLEDSNLMTKMRKNAWEAGREMIWPVVAQRYEESFKKARLERNQSSADIIKKKKFSIPPIKLDHLERMTDQTGLLQHATYHIPNFKDGYCVDDNARALMLTIFLKDFVKNQKQLEHFADIYLAFLSYAFDFETCRFRNFMNYEHQWQEACGSEDSHARAIWATGIILGRSSNQGHRKVCESLFQCGLTPVLEFTSPRAWAFVILGIVEYLHSSEGDCHTRHIADLLAEKLFHLYHRNASSNWKWFEQSVTYDNARLSQALINYGINRPEMLEVGLASLRWLLQEQLSTKGHFSPIGCHGFWKHNGPKAHFDQQPIEASAMVSACLSAYSVTQDPFWKKSAQCCFEWFLGRNDLGLSLYDTKTGGCCDGLLTDRVNGNQGGEALLSFYLACAEMK
jgi:glycosyltransferase involved in cell wall biosynthesis